MKYNGTKNYKQLRKVERRSFNRSAEAHGPSLSRNNVSESEFFKARRSQTADYLYQFKTYAVCREDCGSLRVLLTLGLG
ncbi:MAG TPA: hypothetical protein DCP31_32650 [Cyanobacteria bacterium UBA8543]|nr:hypothetical protein [Cyanobacteria bacterium UBA8543]